MPIRTTLLAILMCLGTVASVGAQIQTRGQQRCIVAVQRSGGAIALALARDFAACVKRAGRGDLPVGETAQHCLTADRSGRVGAARTRMARKVTAMCSDAPSFGAASLTTVNGAFSSLAVQAAVFGPDLDAGIVPAAVDPAGARCQATVAAELVATAAAELRAFTGCARQGLGNGTIRARTDLEDCVGADPQGRVARAMATAEASVARECTTSPIPATLPGRCAAAPRAELFDCLTRQVDCAVCRSLNAAAVLARSCHRSEHGVAVAYCGERPVTATSVARQWNEEILAAIRRDTPRPTVHARNLFHLSAAMWDAWRAYGGGGRAFITDEAHVAADLDGDRATAISFAAYRVLSHRYALSIDAAGTQLHFDRRLEVLGFDKRYTTTEGDAAAAVGNRIGAALIAHGHTDGANEHGTYGDPTYTPANGPLIVKIGGTVMAEPNRWQPLALDFFVTQNGIPIADKVQQAIGMRWNQVVPFALTRSDPDDVYIDPGPPPRLGATSDAAFKAAAVRLIELSSQLTPDDGVLIDVSPGAYGNNALGSDDGTGHPWNPVTALPYAPQIVLRGDFGRVLAEFWADGPASETPPGHWNVIANHVTDATPDAQKQLGGVGAPLSALEWDVKLYLALNGAVHDAAITSWGLKRKYDSVRPISMIRYLGAHGQSSDPDSPSYDPLGLPLVPGLIEIITPASSAPGNVTRRSDAIHIRSPCAPGRGSRRARPPHTAACSGFVPSSGCRIRRVASSRRHSPATPRVTAPLVAPRRRCWRPLPAAHTFPAASASLWRLRTRP